MFYVKKEIGNDIEVKIDLYDDEIFTQCPRCGKEIQADSEILLSVLNDAGLASTSIYCGDCSKEVN